MNQLLLTICLAGLASASWAQEETKTPPKTETPPAAETPAAPSDLQAQWDKLDGRRLSIAKQLQTLGKEFQSATVERKLEIRDEFELLIDEFNHEISPELTKVATQLFEADHANKAAGEFLLQQSFEATDYLTAAATAEKLFAAGDESAEVLNKGGTALFAINQFERAVELLSKAEEKQQLDPSTGGLWIADARDYIELWKTEKAIREQEAAAPEAERNPRAELDTSKGKIVVELYENQAPNTVANFISLIENGTYNGVKFHRYEPFFVIQGGDPNSKDDDPSNDGGGGPGYTIKCECYRDDARMHFGGSLSMAHAGKDTGGSQFFITHRPTPHLNHEPDKTRSNHTVFGQVVEGMDVVYQIRAGDEIISAKVLSKRDHEYKPETTPE